MAKSVFSNSLFGGSKTQRQYSLFGRPNGVATSARAERARAGHRRRRSGLYAVNEKGRAPYRKGRGHLF